MRVQVLGHVGVNEGPGSRVQVLGHVGVNEGPGSRELVCVCCDDGSGLKGSRSRVQVIEFRFQVRAEGSGSKV